MHAEYSGVPIKNRRKFRARKQSGVVLLVSLVVLAVVSVVSGSLMDNAILEERMSAGLLAGSKAMQAAELVLADAESWLAGQAVTPDTSEQNTEGVDVWLPQSLESESGQSWWRGKEPQWWASQGEPAATPLSGIVDVHYIIEEMHREVLADEDGAGSDQPERVYFRITVHSALKQQLKGLLLQTTYSRILYSPDLAASTGMDNDQLMALIETLESSDVSGRLSWRRPGRY